MTTAPAPAVESSAAEPRSDWRQLVGPVLQQYSGDTLATIDRDISAASGKVVNVLQTVRARLFDATLNVNALKAQHFPGRDLATPFRKQVGVSPGQYITKKRLEVAERLLLETDLELWRIAQMVGYSGLPTFGKAFKGSRQLRPAQVREEKQVANPAKLKVLFSTG